MTDTPLMLFNSLTRKLEPFEPVRPGEARVYSCGPTVYNYPHIGNMRAYVFADVLGRTLSFKGYKLTHVINITDVGHLTDDADAGEDKLEKAAKAGAQSIWDIAKHYTEAFWADIKALNIRQPSQWTIATDYIPQMIAFAEGIAAEHCYELDSGLYFDVSTVADYGRLARDDDFLAKLHDVGARLRTGVGFRDSAQSLVDVLRERITHSAQQKYLSMLEIWEPVAAANGAALVSAGQNAIKESRRFLNLNRIEPIEGKRNDEDFAIWRKTPAGETRQMEWDSPWGKGAPGWHLECSVMSGAVLGFPFDIHTGGIDHREIHHPNEIAQNQAHCHSDGSGASIWMHNNFLVERSGKMSKSAGEFLRLQLLIDRGYHPLAYRLMCLQAHYRSELEFSWEGLEAALVRLKRMVLGIEKWRAQADSDVDEQNVDYRLSWWNRFEDRVSDDLHVETALVFLEEVVAANPTEISVTARNDLISEFDQVFGLGLDTLTRTDLRIRPKAATITEPEIDAILARRKEARAAKDFATSDALRDELAAKGVEVMDGDPLGWDWKRTI